MSAIRKALDAWQDTPPCDEHGPWSHETTCEHCAREVALLEELLPALDADEKVRASPATDCPPCRREGCGLATGVPFAASQNTHVDNPAHLICAACGFDWIELDLDRAAQAWRAETAHYRETVKP